MMMEKKNTDEALTLEEAMKQLDETIASLQGHDITLEEAFARYEQGMALVRLCNEKIDLVEKKVTELNEEGETIEFR